jgi:hypothetical protein
VCVVTVRLLRDFGPYGIIFMNWYVVITIDMVMLLKDFGPYRIVFLSMCVYNFRLSTDS